MKKWLLLAALIGCGSPLATRANDAGDLVFPTDFTDYTRWEVRYENIHRDIEITSETPRADDRLNADVLALKANLGWIPNVRLDLELGAMQTDGGSPGLLGGAGLRYLAFDHGPWRVGGFGQVQYVANVSDSQDLAGVGRVDVEYNLLEVDIGALASYRFRVADQFALVPYAGPLVSIMRMSGDIQESTRDGESFEAKENQFFGAAAGLSLESQGVNGIRLEMRVFDAVSISLAAAYVF